MTKQSAVRARIRQLCSLGLPGELLMASLLPALRELVPSDSAGFFWVDAKGDMRNLYAERMLPPEVMELYFERYYDGREAAFRKGFLERAASPDGVIATSPDESFRRTEYYNEILRRLDAHHVLYGIVREQDVPLGQLSMYRPADAPAFTPLERADLVSVMRYVAHGVAAAQARPVDTSALDFEDTDDEAMLVADPSGTVHHASQKARRLLLLATTSTISRATLGAAVNERAAAALKGVCGKLSAMSRGADSEPPVLHLESSWGRYVMRAYRLDDDSGAPDAVMGVRIQRQEPMILRFVRAMGRLPFSPQQREIALQLARGATNSQIADALGLSFNTVGYHIKVLYQKLDVHDRTQALARITSGEAGLKP